MYIPSSVLSIFLLANTAGGGATAEGVVSTRREYIEDRSSALIFATVPLSVRLDRTVSDNWVIYI
jgi:hypothetical protein